MTQYQPEIGQAFFGNPTGEFEVPPYACSLLSGVLSHLDRVFWIVYQRVRPDDEACSVGGLVYRPYCWDDGPDAELPNLQLTGDLVEVRWYKHPGRGQTVNVEMTPGQWAAWHDRLVRALKIHDHEREEVPLGTHPDECYRWHVEPLAVEAGEAQADAPHGIPSATE